MIRAVIFDLGHTIWDIGPTGDVLARAYEDMRQTLARRTGRDDLPPAHAFQRSVADVLREAAPMYFEGGDVLDQPPTHTWVGEGFRRLGVDVDETLLRELTVPLFATEVDRLVCADGTVDALLELDRAGYALGCITNTLTDEATIRLMLRNHGIEDLMRSVVVSAEEGYRKPHASLFEKALRDVGVRPAEAVMVGDSPYHDIGGAKAVGMHAVLTHQYVVRPHEQFEPKPDAIIKHLRELPAVLESLS